MERSDAGRSGHARENPRRRAREAAEAVGPGAGGRRSREAHNQNRAGAMSDARERLIESNGVKLWTARQGYGVPVALLHGGPGACDNLAPVADMIDDLAECLRFDQR